MDVRLVAKETQGGVKGPNRDGQFLGVLESFQSAIAFNEANIVLPAMEVPSRHHQRQTVGQREGGVSMSTTVSKSNRVTPTPKTRLMEKSALPDGVTTVRYGPLRTPPTSIGNLMHCSGMVRLGCHCGGESIPARHFGASMNEVTAAMNSSLFGMLLVSTLPPIHHATPRASGEGQVSEDANGALRKTHP